MTKESKGMKSVGGRRSGGVRYTVSRKGENTAVALKLEAQESSQKSSGRVIYLSKLSACCGVVSSSKEWTCKERMTNTHTCSSSRYIINPSRIKG